MVAVVAVVVAASADVVVAVAAAAAAVVVVDAAYVAAASAVAVDAAFVAAASAVAVAVAVGQLRRRSDQQIDNPLRHYFLVNNRSTVPLLSVPSSCLLCSQQTVSFDIMSMRFASMMSDVLMARGFSLWWDGFIRHLTFRQSK